MDDSKERRKSVKSRRRSLRKLQSADASILDESICDATLVGQSMYGSVWIEQTDSPVHVRKPRRSISCSQISQDLANSVIRNKKNIYNTNHLEKENFSPDPSPIKMVDGTPKITPVLLHSAKSTKSPLGSCSMENIWNLDQSYEEIGVPRFGHRALDGSVSGGDSLVRNISDLSPALDQIPNQEIIQPSPDCHFDFVRSASCSPVGIVSETTTPDSTGEAWNFSDSFPVLSGDVITHVPFKDSPASSTKLCQDFQDLDISKTYVTVRNGSDSELGSSEAENLQEDTLDPSLASEATFHTCLLGNSTLDQCSSVPSDSWCFVKCSPDEESSDVSTLIDSYVTDGCDVWETDLSSAGSELSDSWCFSGRLNTSGHYTSTPFKTPSPKSLINNDQRVEPAVQKISDTKVEVITEHGNLESDGSSSSLCTKMELSSMCSAEEELRLKEEELRLLSMEFLNLEDSPLDVEIVKTLCQGETTKKSTEQVFDSKTKKTKPVLNRTVQSTKKTQSDGLKKSSCGQPSTSIMHNDEISPDLVRKVSSIRTKKPASTVNTKKNVTDKTKAPTDPSKSKSSANLKKNLVGKKGQPLGTRHPNALSLRSEENSTKLISEQKHSPKAGSPDVIILDASEMNEINVAAPSGVTVKTPSQIGKSAKSLSTDDEKPLSGLTNKPPSVDTPSHESNLNQSLCKRNQQADTGSIPVSSDEIKIKADPIETLSDPSVTKRQRKGISTSVSNQVPNKPTVAARTKRRSLDSLATSTVTIRRSTSKSRPKSTDTSHDSETAIDPVPAKEQTKKSATDKWGKHRRRALLIPSQETNDVMVVDLEVPTSISLGSDSISGDVIKNPVTTRPKRKSQPNRPTKDDDLAVLLTADSMSSFICSSGDYKPGMETEKECPSVSSSSNLPEATLNLVVSSEPQDSTTCLVNNKTASCKPARVIRKLRQSTGSIPDRELQDMDTSEALPEPSSSSPVKILDENVLAVQSQAPTTVRRSTRRSSIELSLSLNQQQTSAATSGSSKNTTRVVGRKKNSDDDCDEERLREIYAKKPYVPFSPTRLETIFSPNKKRNCNVFGKRKYKRELAFQPTETQLKNRRKKAMRNWPFLFEVPDIDEKLNILLNDA